MTLLPSLSERAGKVTMLQRSPTTVVRSETLMDLGFKSLYSEAAVAAGIDTDTADLLFASMPFRVHETLQKALVPEFERRDADLYEGLRRAGFLLEGRLARHAVYPNLGPEPRDSLLYAKALR